MTVRYFHVLLLHVRLFRVRHFYFLVNARRNRSVTVT